MDFLLVLVALVIVIVCVAISAEKSHRKYDAMSDKELKKLYKECVENINERASRGSGLTGAGSTIATDKINSEIDTYRIKGKTIGEILISRGYKVDLSVLDKKAVKGGGKKSVVGRAVVGGIIAGPTGAIVGAIDAASKNAEKECR